TTVARHGGGGGAATGAGRGWDESLAGGGDHDRHRRRARADSQGRRPSIAVADFGGARRRDDDHGAIAGGPGEGGADYARDGLRARVPDGRFAAVPGVERWRVGGGGGSFRWAAK